MTNDVCLIQSRLFLKLSPATREDIRAGHADFYSVICSLSASSALSVFEVSDFEFKEVKDWLLLIYDSNTRTAAEIDNCDLFLLLQGRTVKKGFRPLAADEAEFIED